MPVLRFYIFCTKLFPPFGLTPEFLFFFSLSKKEDHFWPEFRTCPRSSILFQGFMSVTVDRFLQEGIYLNSKNFTK